MDNGRKKLILLAVLLIGCLITSLVNSTDNFTSVGVEKEKVSESLVTPNKSKGKKEKADGMLLIQVNGAVNCPGMYLLPKASRVEEAITMAGGVKEEANLERVNMAKTLKDGALVYVPYKTARNKAVTTTESGPTSSHLGANSNLRNAPVSLNNASQRELEGIPGIGPAMAQRIIARRQVKDFSKVEELLEVRGIGKAKLEKLKPYIVL